jgi:hypothetical protein
MSKGAHDVFAIVFNFISSDWEAKDVTIGLFKVIDTIGATLVPKLWELMDKFSLTQNIWRFGENEESNLQNCANALICIVDHAIFWSY